MSGLFKSIGNIFTGGSGTSGSQAAGIADPFASQRPQYQADLANLIKDPSSVTKTPGYQFQFDQGMQALERTLAAGGELSSGKAMTEAIQYGQGFASNQFQQQEQMFAHLGGADIGSPGTAGQLYEKGQGSINQVLSGFLGNAISGLSSLFGAGATSTGTASDFLSLVAM
jgi:hypothetical protein